MPFAVRPLEQCALVAVLIWRSWMDSNHHYRLRTPAFYSIELHELYVLEPETWNQTGDLRFTKAALSLLSYTGKFGLDGWI